MSEKKRVTHRSSEHQYTLPKCFSKRQIHKLYLIVWMKLSKKGSHGSLLWIIRDEIITAVMNMGHCQNTILVRLWILDSIFIGNDAPIMHCLHWSGNLIPSHFNRSPYQVTASHSVFFLIWFDVQYTYLQTVWALLHVHDLLTYTELRCFGMRWTSEWG